MTTEIATPAVEQAAAPAWTELDRLRRSTPMFEAVVDELDGRRIRVGDKWLTDFASCNYLGFDLDPEIMDAVAPAIHRWGTHPSWSRLIASPRPYVDVEERLTELLRAPDTLALPTITHIHSAVIPVLAGRGTVFVDGRAHRTIYDGCAIARGRGAKLRPFPADDVERLEQRLRMADPTSPRVVCMDGINSMTGNGPDLREFARVCREYGALLYVDDAHGFGVIGESPGPARPYGSRGNSIVQHCGETYDNIVLVGGFSKAYSSLLAFLALPTDMKEMLQVAAPPYAYSGPVPIAALATALAGLDVNDRRGDSIRDDLAQKTARVLDIVRACGLSTANTSGFPIVEVALGNVDVAAVGAFLFAHGIYATPAVYPAVPRDQAGFRLQVTAANTSDEIDHLGVVLAKLVDRFVA